MHQIKCLSNSQGVQGLPGNQEVRLCQVFLFHLWVLWVLVLPSLLLSPNPGWGSKGCPSLLYDQTHPFLQFGPERNVINYF